MLALIVGVPTLALAIVAFASLAQRWHHEGLEDAVEDLTSANLGVARSALWILIDGKDDKKFADGTNPVLAEHHFTVLWALERTLIRRERILHEFTSKLVRWPVRRFDQKVRPHVAECLRICWAARRLAVYPDQTPRIKDELTWDRVQMLGQALNLADDGKDLSAEPPPEIVNR